MEHTFIRRSTGEFQKFQEISGILKNWLFFSLETYPIKSAFQLRVFTSCHKPYLGRHFEFLDRKGNEWNPAFFTRRTFPPKCPQTFGKWKTPVDLTTKSIAFLTFLLPSPSWVVIARLSSLIKNGYDFLRNSEINLYPGIE